MFGQWGTVAVAIDIHNLYTAITYIRYIHDHMIEGGEGGVEDWTTLHHTLGTSATQCPLQVTRQMATLSSLDRFSETNRAIIMQSTPHAPYEPKPQSG